MRSEEGRTGILSQAAAGVVVLGLILMMTRPGVLAQPSPSSSTTSLGETTRVEIKATAVLEGVPDSCPVTVPGDNAFTPVSEAPEGPPTVYDVAWYGTPELWTMLDPEGEVWRDLPVGTDGSLTQKTFWWSENYSPEDRAEFTLTGEHLDGSAPTTEVSKQGGRGFNPFMLASTHESVTVVGIGLPEPGCWEITTQYKGATLSYVVWVAP